MTRLDRERAADDLGYFLSAIGCDLRDWQLQPLKLDTRFTAIVAGRQMGKSLSLAGLGLWWAMRKRRQHALIVSATDSGARRLLGQVRGLAADSPLLSGAVDDELAGLITLANGSVIRSVPASERQVRGWTVDLLLIDEAQQVSDDLILGAAFPTTAARPDARIVLAGSAGRTDGAFFDIVRRGEVGDEHTRSHRWVAKVAGGDEDADWIVPSAVAAAQSSMSEARFAAEYLAVFSGSGDLWISRKQLERVLVDRPVFSLAGLAGPARISLGIDWGRRIDRSAAVAIGRIPGEPRFAVVCAHREPADTPGTQFINHVCDSPAAYGYVVSERNGMGEGYCEALLAALRRRDKDRGGEAQRKGYKLIEAHEFERRIAEQARPKSVWDLNKTPEPGPFMTLKAFYHVTGQSKTATYSGLRVLIDREQLVIPRDAGDLIRELLLLSVELTGSGHEKIEASSGHDDLADALGHALVPQNNAGRWRTLVGDLALRQAPEPDIDASRDPGAYQSLTGPHVTSFRRGIKPAPMRLGEYVLNP